MDGKSVSGFTSLGFDEFLAKWQRCRDVYAGSERVKERGAKYLPMSRWHAGSDEGKADYEAFKQRAVFHNYLKDAIKTMLGVLSKGEPTIELPNQLAFMANSATPYKDGLVALNGRLNATILLVGCAGLSLEVNWSGSGTADAPDFYINMWQPETIRDKDFTSDSMTGETFAKFVLLDESDLVFNYATKQRESVRRWRVMALDGQNRYYTALIDPEQWVDFDIDNPPLADDPTNPPTGYAVYPQYRGETFNRVPFTFVNSTDLSGGHFQDPPLLELVDLVLALYRGDADYRQTLHFTASDFYKHTGIQGEINNQNVVVGAGGIAHLPEGFTLSPAACAISATAPATAFRLGSTARRA